MDELRFASASDALRYLSNVVGKRVLVAVKYDDDYIDEYFGSQQLWSMSTSGSARLKKRNGVYIGFEGLNTSEVDAFFTAAGVSPEDGVVVTFDMLVLAGGDPADEYGEDAAVYVVTRVRLDHGRFNKKAFFACHGLAQALSGEMDFPQNDIEKKLTRTEWKNIVNAKCDEEVNYHGVVMKFRLP